MKPEDMTILVVAGLIGWLLIRKAPAAQVASSGVPAPRGTAATEPAFSSGAAYRIADEIAFGYGNPVWTAKPTWFRIDPWTGENVYQ